LMLLDLPSPVKAIVKLINEGQSHKRKAAELDVLLDVLPTPPDSSTVTALDKILSSSLSHLISNSPIHSISELPLLLTTIISTPTK
jgi:hypothetical protein